MTPSGWIDTAAIADREAMRARHARARWRFDALLIGLYLVAIVAANLAVHAFGYYALLVTGFVLIPFDLVTRDALHERWHFRSRLTWWRKMALLIATGSILSVLINLDAWRVAVASSLAFAAAAVMDTIVYSKARAAGFSRQGRMNLSNVASALVDSTVFPLIAFGYFTIGIALSQWILKFVGGAMWAAIYDRVLAVRTAREVRERMGREAQFFNPGLRKDFETGYTIKHLPPRQ